MCSNCSGEGRVCKICDCTIGYNGDCGCDDPKGLHSLADDEAWWELAERAAEGAEKQ